MLIQLWIILFLLLAIALTFVIVPWYRFQQHRTEPSRQNQNTVLGIAVVAICCTSIGLYTYLGAASQLKPWKVVQQEQAFYSDLTQRLHAEHSDPVDVLHSLHAYLGSHPKSLPGWNMLGNLYLSAGHFSEAVTIFKRAVHLDETDIASQAGLIQALFLAADSRITAENQALINQVLTIVPYQPSVLNVVASDAFHRQDYQRAIAVWQSLLDLYPDGSEDRKALNYALFNAQLLLQEKVDTDPIIQAEKTSKQYVRPVEQLNVTIALRPELTDLFSADDSLFIYVKQIDRPMPLWALRSSAATLPDSFRLTRENAMISGTMLPTDKPLIVGARLSKQGTAQAQVGDIQGETIVELDKLEKKLIKLELSEVVS